MLDAATRLAGAVFSDDQQQTVVFVLSQIQAQVITLRYALDSIADYAAVGVNMTSETRAASMVAAQLQASMEILGHSVNTQQAQDAAELAGAVIH